METITIIIALIVAIWVCFEKTEAKPEKNQLIGRTIRHVKIFSLYEVTVSGFYGLCGTKKEEVYTCIGCATFDSYRHAINGLGEKAPSRKNYYGFIAPSNYKLIKSDFIKKEDM